MLGNWGWQVMNIYIPETGHGKGGRGNWAKKGQLVNRRRKPCEGESWQIEAHDSETLQLPPVNVAGVSAGGIGAIHTWIPTKPITDIYNLNYGSNLNFIQKFKIHSTSAKEQRRGWEESTDLLPSPCWPSPRDHRLQLNLRQTKNNYRPRASTFSLSLLHSYVPSSSWLRIMSDKMGHEENS